MGDLLIGYIVIDLFALAMTILCVFFIVEMLRDRYWVGTIVLALLGSIMPLIAISNHMGAL